MTLVRAPGRLRRLAIKQVAGVDLPANWTQVGGDGWMVMKADGTPLVVDDPRVVDPRPVVVAGVDAGGDADVEGEGEAVLRKSDAYAAIVRKSEEIRREEVVRGRPISREQAIVRAAGAHPELVAAYRGALPDLIVDAVADGVSSRPGAAALAEFRSGASAVAKSAGVGLAEGYRRFGESDEGRRLRAVIAEAEGR